MFDYDFFEINKIKLAIKCLMASISSNGVERKFELYTTCKYIVFFTCYSSCCSHKSSLVESLQLQKSLNLLKISSHLNIMAYNNVIISHMHHIGLVFNHWVHTIELSLLVVPWSIFFILGWKVPFCGNYGVLSSYFNQSSI